MPEYSCSYRQLFNVFGAPGIPNEYQAELRRGGKVVERRKFWFRRRAEKQCLRWNDLYSAEIVRERHP